MSDELDLVILEAFPQLRPATVVNPHPALQSGRVAHVAKPGRWSVSWAVAADRFPLTPDEVQVVRYRPGGRYNRHRDAYAGAPARVTTMVLQLTDPDEYTGGHLMIWEPVRHVAARARGAVVTFPAGTMHEVTPVETGTRWAIVAWSAERL